MASVVFPFHLGTEPVSGNGYLLFPSPAVCQATSLVTPSLFVCLGFSPPEQTKKREKRQSALWELTPNVSPLPRLLRLLYAFYTHKTNKKVLPLPPFHLERRSWITQKNFQLSLFDEGRQARGECFRHHSKRSTRNFSLFSRKLILSFPRI